MKVLGDIGEIKLNNAGNDTNVIHCSGAAHYRNYICRGIRSLSSLPRLRFSSHLGDFAVNMIGKDEVFPRANALIVSSGTVYGVLWT